MPTSKSPPPERDNVCAVIVTFHPDEGLGERLDQVLPQVSRIVVVDNGSSELARHRLRALAVSRSLELILLGENQGIAAGLNRGFERAIDLGFEWVLALDQDSVPLSHLVKTLRDIYDAYPRRGELAVIGSNYAEITTGTTATRRLPKTDRPYIEIDEVITSGSLQSLAAYRDVGPYREDFFIYYVDNEYCKRARTKGYRVILTREPLMHHQTGSASKHDFFFYEVVTMNYPAWRHYYIVRNGVLIVREFAKSDPGWAFKRVRGLAKRTLASLVLETDRRDKARFVVRGLVDGLLGRTGKVASVAP